MHDALGEGELRLPAAYIQRTERQERISVVASKKIQPMRLSPGPRLPRHPAARRKEAEQGKKKGRSEEGEGKK